MKSLKAAHVRGKSERTPAQNSNMAKPELLKLSNSYKTKLPTTSNS
jgi:hypothetical protein